MSSAVEEVREPNEHLKKLGIDQTHLLSDHALLVNDDEKIISLNCTQFMSCGAKLTVAEDGALEVSESQFQVTNNGFYIAEDETAFDRRTTELARIIQGYKDRGYTICLQEASSYLISMLASDSVITMSENKMSPTAIRAIQSKTTSPVAAEKLTSLTAVVLPADKSRNDVEKARAIQLSIVDKLARHLAPQEISLAQREKLRDMFCLQRTDKGDWVASAHLDWTIRDIFRQVCVGEKIFQIVREAVNEVEDSAETHNILLCGDFNTSITLERFPDKVAPPTTFYSGEERSVDYLISINAVGEPTIIDAQLVDLGLRAGRFNLRRTTDPFRVEVRGAGTINLCEGLEKHLEAHKYAQTNLRLELSNEKMLRSLAKLRLTEGVSSHHDEAVDIFRLDPKTYKVITPLKSLPSLESCAEETLCLTLKELRDHLGPSGEIQCVSQSRMGRDENEIMIARPEGHPLGIQTSSMCCVLMDTTTREGVKAANYRAMTAYTITRGAVEVSRALFELGLSSGATATALLVNRVGSPKKGDPLEAIRYGKKILNAVVQTGAMVESVGKEEGERVEISPIQTQAFLWTKVFSETMLNTIHQLERMGDPSWEVKLNQAALLLNELSLGFNEIKKIKDESKGKDEQIATKMKILDNPEMPDERRSRIEKEIQGLRARREKIPAEIERAERKLAALLLEGNPKLGIVGTHKLMTDTLEQLSASEPEKVADYLELANFFASKLGMPAITLPHPAETLATESALPPKHTLEETTEEEKTVRTASTHTKFKDALADIREPVTTATPPKPPGQS